MRLSIFRKAEKLVDKVVYNGEGRGMAFFTFKDIKDPPIVSFKCENGRTELNSCTCRHHSIHLGVAPTTLCSYVVSVIVYLAKRK